MVGLGFPYLAQQKLELLARDLRTAQFCGRGVPFLTRLPKENEYPMFFPMATGVWEEEEVGAFVSPFGMIWTSASGGFGRCVFLLDEHHCIEGVAGCFVFLVLDEPLKLSPFEQQSSRSLYLLLRRAG